MSSHHPPRTIVQRSQAYAGGLVHDIPNCELHNEEADSGASDSGTHLHCLWSRCEIRRKIGKSDRLGLAESRHLESNVDRFLEEKTAC